MKNKFCIYILFLLLGCMACNFSTTQEKYKTLMTKAEAKQLQEYMAAVCEYGTGRIMAVIMSAPASVTLPTTNKEISVAT